MEWLATILTSSNAILVIGGLILLILVVAFLSKKGLVSLNIKGIKVGSQDIERTIIRQQLAYVDAAVIEMLSEIPKKATWNEWKSKCTAADVKDILQTTIAYNHISNNRSYVLVKKKAIWSAIQNNDMTDKYYKGEEFKQLVYNWVEKVVDDLLDIRKYYEESSV